MKNRSELREIIIKIIYQVNMFEESKLDYDLNDLIKLARYVLKYEEL